MVEHPPHRHLVLILARSFASRLATPVFLVDADGVVVYFNEAAEDVLGQRFIEGHGMTPEEWMGLFRPSDDEGNPIPMAETPLGVAIERRESAHGRLVLHGADGVARPIEATAFPLLAHAGQFVGGIAIFWERSRVGGDGA